MLPVGLNQPSPFPPLPGDGAVLDFFTKGSNILHLQLTGFRTFEAQAIQRNPILAGVLHRGGAILLLFQFSADGKPVMTYACPFDIRRIPAEFRDIPTLDGSFDRLLFTTIAVDEGGIVRALRAVTLPKSVTEELLTAVAEQVECSDTGQSSHASWGRYEPVELAEKYCGMEVCGR